MVKEAVYRQYDEKNLNNAVAAVRRGELSQRRAAQQFGVPKSTIADRISGRVQEGAKPGKPTILPEKVEKSIAKEIIKCADEGFGLTPKQVRIKTGKGKLLFTKISKCVVLLKIAASQIQSCDTNVILYFIIYKFQVTYTFHLM